MLCAAAKCVTRERRGRLMIDTIIQAINSKLVSYSGKMDDGIALLQQWLPVDRHR